jgi:hypothetical protein
MDYESDERDGVLFRFWIRMASYPGGSPLKLIKAFGNMRQDGGHITPADYRKALTELAIQERINLP